MNFAQHLCTLTLIIFSCTLNMNGLGTQDIKTLGEKIKTGKKISDEELEIIEALKEEIPDIISNEALKLLVQHGRIPNARTDLRSSKSSEKIDRKAIADQFLSYSNES